MIVSLMSFPLLCSDMEKKQSQKPMHRHGHGRGDKQGQGKQHPMHHGKHQHHPVKSERHRQMFESLNKDQQSVYTEIHNLQNNIRKNMHALGQERRNIKNLKNNDSRKQSQASINKICSEIKQNIEEHQPRIIEAIDGLQ